MEKNTIDLDRIIWLADSLRRYSEQGNAVAMSELMRGCSRLDFECIIYALLHDLEAATSR